MNSRLPSKRDQMARQPGEPQPSAPLADAAARDHREAQAVRRWRQGRDQPAHCGACGLQHISECFSCVHGPFSDNIRTTYTPTCHRPELELLRRFLADEGALISSRTREAVAAAKAGGV